MLRFYPLLFASLLPVINSCTPAGNADRDTLVIIDNSPIKKGAVVTLDILSTSVLGDLIYSPLIYAESADGWTNVHNVLVEEVKVHRGNRSIDIKLREGVRSHDGKEVTSREISQSIETIVKKQAHLFGGLYDDMEVEFVDGKTLRITSGTPIFDIEHFLNNIYAYLPFSSGVPVGTGPFRFSSWLDDGVELAANEDYFEGSPNIKKVRYICDEEERRRLARLLRNEADILPYLTPETARFLEKDPRFQVHKYTAASYSAVFFNMNSPLFREREVRKAVSLAIDRDTLIEKSLKGGGFRGWGLVRANTMGPSSPFDYNPGEAVRLLKEAGWRAKNGSHILEKKGRRLSFTLYCNSDFSENWKISDILSRQLFEVGIEMEVVPVSQDEFRRTHLKKGMYGAYLDSNRRLDYQIYNTWHSSMPETNLTGYDNLEMDRLLEEIRVSNDQEAKQRMYGKMEEILEEEVPAAYLYNPVSFHATSKRFKGAEDFAGNVYSVYKIKDWRIDESFR